MSDSDEHGGERVSDCWHTAVAAQRQTLLGRRLIGLTLDPEENASGG